jgi:hypothetical protein
MGDEHVARALQALAEHDRALEAPPEVEARLRKEFRLRRLTRTGQRAALWAGLAAAAVAISAIVLDRPPQPAPAPPVAVAPPRQDIESQAPAPPRAVTKTAKRAPAPHAPPQEVFTDFFPLMNPAPPFERGQMLRVTVPAAAMQTVGLPVREDHLADPVQADVLLSEEGLPRAIRFVRFEIK